MSCIYVISGPCGCGKSTFTEAFASHLVNSGGRNQVYVIHGDSFHNGLVTTEREDQAERPGFLYWPDILRFNWECIVSVADKALEKGLDVIVDYVVEDELPLMKALARRHRARLYYVVLTASEEELTRRLMGRGSSELIGRSLFLKKKLDHAPEHSAYQYDISGKSVQEEIAGFDIAKYEVTEG